MQAGPKNEEHPDDLKNAGELNESELMSILAGRFRSGEYQTMLGDSCMLSINPMRRTDSGCGRTVRTVVKIDNQLCYCSVKEEEARVRPWDGHPDPASGDCVQSCSVHHAATVHHPDRQVWGWQDLQLQEGPGILGGHYTTSKGLCVYR